MNKLRAFTLGGMFIAGCGFSPGVNADVDSSSAEIDAREAQVVTINNTTVETNANEGEQPTYNPQLDILYNRNRTDEIYSTLDTLIARDNEIVEQLDTLIARDNEIVEQLDTQEEQYNDNSNQIQTLNSNLENRAVTAMGLESSNNPLNHDRFTPQEAKEAMGIQDDNNPYNHVKRSVDTIVAITQTVIGSLTDSNPTNHTKRTVAQLTNLFSNFVGVLNNNNSMNHNRYTDSEAINAVRPYLPTGSYMFGTVCGVSEPHDGNVGGWAGIGDICRTTCDSDTAHLCSLDEVHKSLQIGIEISSNSRYDIGNNNCLGCGSEEWTKGSEDCMTYEEVLMYKETHGGCFLIHENGADLLSCPLLSWTKLHYDNLPDLYCYHPNSLQNNCEFEIPFLCCDAYNQ